MRSHSGSNRVFEKQGVGMEGCLVLGCDPSVSLNLSPNFTPSFSPASDPKGRVLVDGCGKHSSLSKQKISISSNLPTIVHAAASPFFKSAQVHYGKQRTTHRHSPPVNGLHCPPPRRHSRVLLVQHSICPDSILGRTTEMQTADAPNYFRSLARMGAWPRRRASDRLS